MNERGEPMPVPPMVEMALVADGLARRYGVLPTTVLADDVLNLQIAEIAMLMQDGN